MKTRACLLALALSTVLLMTAHCDNDVAGNGTQTGNPSVTAMLRNPGGSPAAHAKVLFVPVNHNPNASLSKALATVDSTTTDANGNYKATLDTGTYNVLASGDSGILFQDSIAVVKDTTVHPPADTLKAPGSLTGVVRLQPGDDARKVFILVMGTNSFSSPSDAVGNFRLANMADGRYSVRILSILDNYGVLDTSLAVRAGKNDTLADTIVLPYTGIPVPSGLKISYDTLKQIVALTWSKPTTGRIVKGYNIYRMNVDSNTTLATINLHLVTDTAYSDSTGVQDQTYAYRVAVVDSNGTEGVKSAGISVSILPALKLIRTIGTSGLGTGQYSAPVAISVVRTGELLVVDNKRGVVLRYDTMGNFMNEVSGFIAPVGVASLTDTAFLVGDDMSTTSALPGIVNLVDSSGARIFQIVGSDSLSGKFGNQSAPWGFAVSPSGRICIPDQNSNRIVFFGPQGSFQKSLTIEQPFSVCFVSESVLAVGTTGAVWGISLIDSSGIVLNSWPSSAVFSPCITPNGNIAVVDYGNAKIKFFTTHGDFLAVAGGIGQGNVKFTDLRAIAVAETPGILFAVDDFGKAVKMLSYPSTL